MIARHWRGWTSAHDADAYEEILTKKVLPKLREIEGYKGGYVLRAPENDEVEFVVMNFFDSLEAVKRFAGPNYAMAVFEPEVKALLTRIEPTARHYDVRAATPTITLN